MTPGESARTVIAMLEADLRGELTEQAFVELVDDSIDLATMTSMYGMAIQLFSALADQNPESARDVLQKHRQASFDMD